MPFGPNLLSNPGAEVDVSGWTSTNCTIARVTTPVHSGVGAFRLTATAAGDIHLTSAVNIRVTPGQAVQISAWARTAATARYWQIQIDWYDAAVTTYLSTSGGGGPGESTAYQQATGIYTAPARAGVGIFGVVWTSTVVGEIHYTDDVFLGVQVAPTVYASPVPVLTAATR